MGEHGAHLYITKAAVVVLCYMLLYVFCLYVVCVAER